jgi:hypothetical protein
VRRALDSTGTQDATEPKRGAVACSAQVWIAGHGTPPNSQDPPPISIPASSGSARRGAWCGIGNKELQNQGTNSNIFETESIDPRA